MMARFKDLMVWQEAHLLCIEVYSQSDLFPIREKYGLSAQIRRSALSVCCNIAEMTGKFSRKDQNRYIEIAFGSLMETLNLVYLASSLRYIEEPALKELENKVEHIAKMLSGLRTRLKGE